MSGACWLLLFVKSHPGHFKVLLYVASVILMFQNCDDISKHLALPCSLVCVTFVDKGLFRKVCLANVFCSSGCVRQVLFAKLCSPSSVRQVSFATLFSPGCCSPSSVRQMCEFASISPRFPRPPRSPNFKCAFGLPLYTGQPIQRLAEGRLEMLKCGGV